MTQFEAIFSSNSKVELLGYNLPCDILQSFENPEDSMPFIIGHQDYLNIAPHSNKIADKRWI